MRKSITPRKAFFYLAVLFATTIFSLTMSPWSPASAQVRPATDGQYVLTVYSCTHWTCTSGGSLNCPGLDWTPPGC